MVFLQQLVKEVPAGHAGFQPYIGRVHAAVYLKARLLQPFPDDLGVALVAGDGLAALGRAIRAVYRGGGALHRVADAVEFAAHAAFPHGVQLSGGSVGQQALHPVGNDHPAAAGAGKTGGFGIGAAFNGHILRALDFVNAGRGPALDKGLVGGIVHNHGPVLPGVVHKGLQLVPGQGGAGGVVGVAQVNHIHRAVRQGRHKVVFRVAGQVDQPVPPVAHKIPRPARHGVGIHIHGIDGIGHGDDRVVAEQLLHVAYIALGPVGHKHLVLGQVNAQGLVVVLQNGIDQEIIAVVRAVAVEGFRPAHFQHGLFKRLHNGGGQGAGYVADAQTNQVRVRVLGAVFPDPPGDFGKQVAAGQLVIIGVYL